MLMSRKNVSSICAVSLGVLLALGALFAVPTGTYAQSEQCQCVCNTPSGTVAGRVSNLSDAPSECAADCADRGTGATYQTCTTDTSVLKQGSAKCWTEQECTNRLVDVNGRDVPSEWATTQPADCPAGLHYCYSPPIPVNLNVAVKTLSDPKAAGNLGEYIIALYDLLLPSAALIAVVLIMVSGVQYVLAGGKQAAIQKAKERMGKAVTGLVLIMCAYAIVYLIDPRLTSFDALRVPVLKGAIFLDENSTCEFVTNPENTGGVQIEVDYIRGGTDPNETSESSCGAICEITEIPEGAVFAGDLEVGDQFFEDYCSNNDASCVISGGGEKLDQIGTCVRCWDVYPGNEHGLVPSNTTCGRFDPVDQLRNEDGSFETYGRCFFSRDADVAPDAVADVQTYVSGGTCAIFAFGCGAIQECSDYGAQQAIAGPAPDPGDSALEIGFEYITGQLGDVASIYELEGGSVNYQSVCQEDPCNVGCSWDGSQADPADRCVPAQ